MSIYLVNEDKDGSQMGQVAQTASVRQLSSTLSRVQLTA
jgi:hypothetical protein